MLAGYVFVLAAMSVAMKNYITEEQKNRILEVLKMTSLIQDLVQEKKQYGQDMRAYTLAETYVALVDKKIKETGLSLEKACKEVGIEPATYDMSKIVMRDKADVVLV